MQAYSTIYWYKSGMRYEKIMVGIPTYARAFQLLSSYLHRPYSPAVGYSSQFGPDLDNGQVTEKKET